MGIYIDAADLLGEEDWKRLRKEALVDLLNERGPVSPGFISDLVDARSAIAGHRYGQAYALIERALRELTPER